MKDWEIEKLCAEALGYRVKLYTEGDTLGVWAVNYNPENVRPRDAPFRPLSDGHQALMLVDKLRLCVNPPFRHRQWLVFTEDEGEMPVHAENADLKRAICECVVKYVQSWP